MEISIHNQVVGGRGGGHRTGSHLLSSAPRRIAPSLTILLLPHNCVAAPQYWFDRPRGEGMKEVELHAPGEMVTEGRRSWTAVRSVHARARITRGERRGFAMHLMLDGSATRMRESMMDIILIIQGGWRCHLGIALERPFWKDTQSFFREQGSLLPRHPTLLFRDLTVRKGVVVPIATARGSGSMPSGIQWLSKPAASGSI